MATNTPSTVSIQRAAERAGVSRHTIKEAIQLGQLQAVSLGHRRRILSASLEALLAGEMGPTSERPAA
jgi:excisionase family DNA binding protein